MKTNVRQPYTGYYLWDCILEHARKMAEKDGRLRYVYTDRISLKPKRAPSYTCMGASDWAVIQDGKWIKKTYEN